MSHIGFDGVDPAGRPVVEHYGVLRRSGRYPWGSGGKWGDAPNSEAGRASAMLAVDKAMRADGINEVDRAAAFGMTVKQLRETKTVARNADRQHKVNQITKLRDKGVGTTEIGRKLGIPEPTVRSLLEEGVKDKAAVLTTTTNLLRDEATKQGVIDIGSGVENWHGISRQKLDSALSVLKDEGFDVFPVQVDTGKAKQKITVRVLAKPGITYREVTNDPSMIGNITKYTEDSGRTILGMHNPLSFSSRRLGINYKEDGGDLADGVLYVRPGKDNVSLGGKAYAQVRVMVDGTHYIKGMAMYKNDLPEGVDIVFNTNKSKVGTKSKLDVLKELKTKDDGSIDTDNPFGSFISRQIGKNLDDPTKAKLSSVMNIVNEEGVWGDWTRDLSSQVLSKQSTELARRQLDLNYEKKKAGLDEILSYTNPSVRKKLLEGFADEADRGAVTLRGAAMKDQATHVILPINTLKDNEIYAPNYPAGERLALVRFPHGGKFEIPELVNNTNHPEAKKLLGNATDAVGINARVAERLSGADFDGDTVLVIPQRGKNVLKSQAPLRALAGFDPKREYPPYDGMKTIDGGTYNAATKKVVFPTDPVTGKIKKPRSFKGNEMGMVSNLITDMTIAGASNDEIARAVKHSMVAIDSEKHVLDWKASAEANGIPALREKYQGRAPGGQLKGAATIVSRARSETDVRARKGTVKIDPTTGRKIYQERPGWVGPDGQMRYANEKISKLEKALDEGDAFTVTSGGSKKNPGTAMEGIYAEHANRMRALADEGRKQMVNTKTIKRDPSAARTYAKEVQSLNDQLNIALRNRPLERQARVIAAHTVKLKTESNPNMDKNELKKLNAMALNEARLITGAKKKQIDITPNEWAAIQAGAISPSMLKVVLDNTDLDTVKNYALPRAPRIMDSGKRARAIAMAAGGATQAEIAAQLGVSLTTLKDALKEG